MSLHHPNRAAAPILSYLLRSAPQVAKEAHAHASPEDRPIEMVCRRRAPPPRRLHCASRCVAPRTARVFQFTRAPGCALPPPRLPTSAPQPLTHLPSPNPPSSHNTDGQPPPRARAPREVRRRSPLLSARGGAAPRRPAPAARARASACRHAAMCARRTRGVKGTAAGSGASLC